MKEIYYIQHPEQILSPGLVVFQDVLHSNLQEMLKIAQHADRLRPHCKTHKMAAVIKHELELGITKHKAATIAEAEMLAQAGVNDIFLAYNIVGPNIERLVSFCNQYPTVEIMVTGDDANALQSLSTAMTSAGKQIGVVLDLNTGQHRTGVDLTEEGISLYQHINQLPGLHAAGLHVYDGHLHQANFLERLAAVELFWENVSQFKHRLLTLGLPVPRIICGGTPTFPAYAMLDDPLIELSPGTCVFHDAGYGNSFSDLSVFTPAALLLTRVISRPTRNRITFDLGTKAVASDPPQGQRLILPDLPDAVHVLHNEEHLVVETDRAEDYQPGDWTLAIPQHICPCSALHQQATVIQDGNIVDHWVVIARDRKLTI